jgi:hypothetical protein
MTVYYNKDEVLSIRKRVIFLIYFGSFFGSHFQDKAFSSLGKLLSEILARCANQRGPYLGLGCF